MTPEAKVKKKFREAVKEACAEMDEQFFLAHYPGTAYGRGGMSDYFGCVCGMMFCAEIKAEGNKLTPLQQECKTVLLAAGVRYWEIIGNKGVEKFEIEFREWIRSLPVC